MDEGLGALGFWVFLGLVVAAAIVSGALKERDKEREKQAMLRALLEKEGNSAAEVLAYMREKDAAYLAEGARLRAGFWRGLKALAIGLFAFVLGLFAFGAFVRLGLLRDSESALVPLVPLVTMFGIWVAGLIIARRLWRSGKQKNDAHPNA
jgi:hypothetical protein